LVLLVTNTAPRLTAVPAISKSTGPMTKPRASSSVPHRWRAAFISQFLNFSIPQFLPTLPPNKKIPNEANLNPLPTKTT